jgi:hypothetical protein
LVRRAIAGGAGGCHGISRSVPRPASTWPRAAGAIVIVSFEVEAAQILEQTADAEPRLTTGMANILAGRRSTSRGCSSRHRRAGLTANGSAAETNGAVNLGGGVKIGLAGPLKLRLDYRLFRLRGTRRHRVYAGATLGF